MIARNARRWAGLVALLLLPAGAAGQYRPPPAPVYRPPPAPVYRPPPAPVYRPPAPVYRPPAYNPPVYRPTTPAYRPTTPAYNPPAYRPANASVYRPTTTIYRPNTTVYRPNTTIYRPTTAILRPTTTIYRPTTTIYRMTTFPRTTMYRPATVAWSRPVRSPTYRSPTFTSTRRTTTPRSSVLSGGGWGGGNRPALRLAWNNPGTPLATARRLQPIAASYKADHKATRQAFRNTVRQTLLKDGTHPLRFLLDQKTLNQKKAKNVRWARGDAQWDAGRVAHARSGTADLVGIESRRLNRSAGGKYEARGIGPVRRFIDVKGVPVEERTARRWVKQGHLKEADLGGWHPGWSR